MTSTTTPPHPARARFVRPYVLTGGRTNARAAELRPSTSVVATESAAEASSSRRFPPEVADLLVSCDTPRTVAWLASAVRLPLGVVRVLVDDLVTAGYLQLPDLDLSDRSAADPPGAARSPSSFDEALATLRSL